MSSPQKASRSRRRSTRRPWRRPWHPRRLRLERADSVVATAEVATAAAAGAAPAATSGNISMSGPIKVAVAGHRGKVGSILAAALAGEPDFDYVGGIGAGDDLGAFLRERRPQALVDL